MSVRDLGEFPLISRITAGLRLGQGVWVGPGDDAAMVSVPQNSRMLLTCDVMVEGVHFLSTADPTDVGFKLMTANISDIAAMGGEPLYALVALVLPADTEVRWVDLLYNGIRICAEKHGVSVVGGDVSSGSSITLSVALVGCVDPDRFLLRSGARPGDVVMVTGALGAAQVGLELHTGSLSAYGILAEQALSRHLRPSPRVDEGKALAALGCRAANDISDGLASEAWEIAEASKVALYIEAERVPIHPSVSLCAHDSRTALDYALTSGEEYELLFTIPESAVEANPDSLAGCYRIGTVREGRGAYLQRGGTVEPLGRGHTHFDSGGGSPGKE